MGAILIPPVTSFTGKRAIRVGFNGNSLFDGYGSQLIWQAAQPGFNPDSGIFAWNRNVGQTIVGLLTGFSSGRYLVPHAGGAGGRIVSDCLGIGNSNSAALVNTIYPQSIDARLDRRILQFDLDCVVHQWATNEGSNTTSLQMSIQAFQEQYINALEICAQNGLINIVMGPPVHTNTAANDNPTWNAARTYDSYLKWQFIWLMANWLRDFCAANKIPFLDTRLICSNWNGVDGYNGLPVNNNGIDPYTGTPMTQPNWNAGFTPDGTHWRTGVGTKAVVAPLVALLDNTFGALPNGCRIAQQVNSDGSDPGGNIISTPFFNRGLTSSRPVGWTSSGDTSDTYCVCSLNDPTAGDVLDQYQTANGLTGAKWLTLTRTAYFTSARTIRQAVALSSSTRYALSYLLKTSGSDDTNYDAANKPFYMRHWLRLTDANFGTSGPNISFGPFDSTILNTPSTGMYVYTEFVTPPSLSGNQYLEFQNAIQTGSTSTGFPTLQVSGVCLRPIADNSVIQKQGLKSKYLINTNTWSPTETGGKMICTLTANNWFVVPQGYAIQSILWGETAGAAVTGGIKIGTTSGAADVVVAQAIGASTIGQIADASILIKYFSSSTDQKVYVNAITSWNSASVTLTVMMNRLIN